MQRLFQEVCPQEALHAHEHPESWHRYCLHSTREMAGVISDVLAELRLAGYSNQDTFSIRLALEEAIVNAIKHGHREDPGKQVEVRYRVTDRCLLAEIQDEGPGFDPADIPDPLAPENLEREGGRGLHLIHCYMSWVRYNDTGNCVTLCKRRSPEDAKNGARLPGGS